MYSLLLLLLLITPHLALLYVAELCNT